MVCGNWSSAERSKWRTAGAARAADHFAGPGIPAGARSDALCYLYDVFPTLGARCGVPPPPKSEGQDLAPTLRRATAKNQR